MLQFLKSYQLYFLIGLIVIAGLQFLIIMAFNSRLSRMSRLLRSLFAGPSGEDLAAMLKRCLAESKESLKRSDELEERLAALAAEMRACVQHIGLVRYDAYNDVSGQQSFSLALLDGYHNGAIITVLFGRHDSRCYGKAVFDGRSEQTLTDEEASALQMALRGGIASLAPAFNGRR